VRASLELEEEHLAVVAQLLLHPDFRRVVAGDGQRLDGLEEVPADLVLERLVLVGAQDGEQRGLLLRARLDEVGSEELVAAAVEPGARRLSTRGTRRLARLSLHPSYRTIDKQTSEFRRCGDRMAR
jgi:hypothetical protein